MWTHPCSWNTFNLLPPFIWLACPIDNFCLFEFAWSVSRAYDSPVPKIINTLSYFAHAINWFIGKLESLFCQFVRWEPSLKLWPIWSKYHEQELFKKAQRFCRNALNSVSVPLYLVEVQIDPLKADLCLVAHRNQHRVWILKLRTLCSLRRHQNKSVTATFKHLHFKCGNHLTDTLICGDR